MKHGFWAVVVVWLAAFSASAQNRYYVSGSVFYGSCGELRVEMGDQSLLFSKPTSGNTSASLVCQMISTPTTLSSNYSINWFVVGDQSCCVTGACGATAWTKLQETSSNCWTLNVTTGSWQLRLFFTKMQLPVITSEQCDFTRVAEPTNQCRANTAIGWYVTDKTNPVDADWKQMNYSDASIDITANAVAQAGISNPYVPLLVCYRYRSIDSNLPGFSDFSGRIPIKLFHAAPQLTTELTHQLCESLSGMTIRNLVAVLPQVRLTIRRDLGNGNWEYTVNNKLYDKADLANAFFKLAPGSYEMTAYNYGSSIPGDECYKIFNFVISRNTPAVAITAVPVHETCFGPTGTGSISLTAGGNTITPPYTYAWAHDATLHDKDLTGLAGDKTYSVTVKDKNGCVGTRDILIEEPDPIEVTEAYVSSSHNGADVSCPANTIGIQNDGAIRLAAHGGTGQLAYRLAGEVHAAPSQTSGDFTNLSADVYKIYVKDIRGCEIEHTLDVPVTAPPDIRHSRMTVVPLRCNGIAEGTIEVVNARGGTGALMYGIAGVGYQASPVIANRNGQTYTVSIRDANGCRHDTAVVVDQPPMITFNPIVLVPQSCTAVVDGALTASASGGTGLIEYALTDTNSEYNSSGAFGPLPSGTYTVYARDANRCVVPSVAQRLPMKPAINAVISVRDSISCHGEHDGALRLTIRGGGTGPYSIQWADQRGATEEISGLGAASYSVTVTDAKTCQQNWTFPLVEPGLLTAQPQISDYEGFGVRCTDSTDGAITLQMQGGTTPYQYTWTDGPQTRDRTALSPGTYAVSVADHHGCKTSASNIIVTAPSPLALRLAGQKDISCYSFRNGIITLEATGGAGVYQYSRDLTTWQPDSFFVDLPVGDYTLYTRDGNGCTTGAIQASLSQPTALELNQLDKVETTCGQANGMVLIELKGGVRNYSYAWYDESGVVVATTVRAENLAAGDYHFIGTDANACTIEKRYTVNDSDGPKVKELGSQRLTCHDSNDGAISVEVREGLAPYTISWDIPGESGLSVSQVTGGEHWIKVLDSRGCQNKTDFFVDYPEALRITPAQTMPLCFGGGDGSIEVSAAGGNSGGYTYTWITGEIGPRRDGLTAGRYGIVVRDTKNCVLEQDIVLGEPARYTVDAGGDRTICRGQQLTVLGPDDAVSYRWLSTAGYESTARNVLLTVPAQYTLEVINANGCRAEDHFMLETSDDLLQADFLMAAAGIAGDTIVLVDISWPVPENIGWTFPAGAQVIETGDAYAAIVLPEAGVYSVTLNTFLGECLDDLVKEITISGARPAAGGRERAGVLKRFDIYPNPNEGSFAVQVEFANAFTGSLTLIGLSGNQMLWRETLSERTSYEVRPVLQQLPAGIYLLVLDSGGKHYYKRMVKK